MHVCDLPEAAANRACYLCAGSIDSAGPRKFIDTGIAIEFEGVLCICEVCVLLMASMFGGASPKEHADLGGNFDDLVHEMIGAEARIEELEDQVDAMKRTIEAFGAEKMLAEVSS